MAGTPQATQPQSITSSPSSAAPALGTQIDPSYDHTPWLADLRQLGPALGLSNMEIRILELTQECVNYQSGETWVSARKIATKMGHAKPTRVWDTWAKAALLGIMTRPYARPNEPANRHHRALRMKSHWQSSADPDGGLPKQGSGQASAGRGVPDLGSENLSIRGAVVKDDLDQDHLSQNERTDQITSSSLMNEPEADRSITPALSAADVAEQLALSFDPVVGELVRRDVATDDAQRWLTRYGSKQITAQISEFDRQRTRGVPIRNAGAWFQSALERGYAKPGQIVDAPAAAPYAHQNAANASTESAVRQVSATRDSAMVRLASMLPEEREVLLTRAIERDEQLAVANYRASKVSLRNQVAAMNAAGVNPFERPRVLIAIAELIDVNASGEAKS
ncbi:MAG: hypothetical protein H7Z14_04875 [Anaerolineae bacterium]|nr:hypothetical protein [Phycisphaerae bacterium]